MEFVLRLFIPLGLLALGGTARAGSYVVLQDSDENSLVRVSTDGKSVTTIARGIPGVATGSADKDTLLPPWGEHDFVWVNRFVH